MLAVRDQIREWIIPETTAKACGEDSVLLGGGKEKGCGRNAIPTGMPVGRDGVDFDTFESDHHVIKVSND